MDFKVDGYLDSLPIITFVIDCTSQLPKLVFQNQAAKERKLFGFSEGLNGIDGLLGILQSMRSKKKSKYIVLEWGSFFVFEESPGLLIYTEVSRSRLDWKEIPTAVTSFEEEGTCSFDVEEPELEMLTMTVSTCSWVNQLPIAIFRVDSDFGFIFTNASFQEAINGIGSETTLCAYVHDHDIVKLQDLKLRLQNRVKSGEQLNQIAEEIEFRWKPKQNQGEKESWTFARIVVETSRDGKKMSGFLGIVSNRTISKLKEAEETIKEAEDQIKTLKSTDQLLSEWAVCGLSRCGLDGKILSVNRAWKQIVGIQEDLNSWPKLLAPEGKEETLAAWSQFVEQRDQPFNRVFRTITSKSLQVLASLNGEGTAFFVSVVDVTEREEQRELEAFSSDERLKVALEEKRAQEELVDITSHEIRSPTSSIINNAVTIRESLEILKASSLDLDHLELQHNIEGLESIEMCAKLQARIADDILGLASIKLARYSITPQPANLLDLASKQIKSFGAEAKSKRIRLTSRISPNIPSTVLIDSVRLSQILGNLLSNSLRFTSRSTTRKVKLTIDISSKRPLPGAPLVAPAEGQQASNFDPSAPLYILFSVSDTGLGMTPLEVSRLFRYLTQASPTTHAKYAGSGLGLWICRKLTNLMNGEIEVISELGRGSEFRGFIEAAPYSPDEANLPIRPESLRLNSYPGKALNILICDDNQISSTILKRQLERAGHTVTAAFDGREGIEKVEESNNQQSPYDVVLMDFEMPELDGLQATKQIRQREIDLNRKKLRIVGLTGNARVEQLETGRSAGMDELMTKPYNIQELLIKIQIPSLNSPANSEDSIISYMSL